MKKNYLFVLSSLLLGLLVLCVSMLWYNLYYKIGTVEKLSRVKEINEKVGLLSNSFSNEQLVGACRKLSDVIENNHDYIEFLLKSIRHIGIVWPFTLIFFSFMSYFLGKRSTNLNR